MPAIEVREPTADDWAVWREVRLRSLQDSPGAFGSTYEQELGLPEEFWRERLDDPGGVCVLAWQDGLPVGIGGGYQDLPGHLHVVAMWVSPERRGQRVSHLVLDHLRQWADRRGLRLHLDVETSNAAARRSYESYGFVGTGETEPLREGSSEVMERMVLSGTQAVP
jgi:GNAT superfamily N-acetyltransferase